MHKGLKYFSDIDEKISLIKRTFDGLIGGEIQSYELCQIWCEEEKVWDNWMDIPLFLTINGVTLSISWTQFDSLGIEKGRILSFSLGGSTIRWLCEGVDVLDSIIGERIETISIGKGEMTIEKNEIEIWTRLFFTLSNGYVFEIFNALDENGFEIHQNQINFEVKKCI